LDEQRTKQGDEMTATNKSSIAKDKAFQPSRKNPVARTLLQIGINKASHTGDFMRRQSGGAVSFILAVLFSFLLGFLVAVFIGHRLGYYSFDLGKAATAKTPSQLVIGIESEPERLDPLTIKNPKTFILSWQIYEGLLSLDEAGNIIPVLAEQWETKDFKTWVFHIRKNATFHASEIFGTSAKSRPVTAQDVLWSYTAFCSSGAYSSFLLTDSVEGCADYNAGKATSVAGLKALDDYTLQIKLIKPEPFFLNRLTTPWIAVFPKEAMEPALKDKWGLQLAVGTGPYRLKSLSSSEIVLEKNEGYWDKTRLPNVTNLVYRVLKNDQIRFAELNKKKIDLMVLPTQLFPSVLDKEGKLDNKYQNDFQIKTLETFNTHMIGINTIKVPNVHLRRAIYFGTNREVIVEKVLYGFGDVTGGTIPAGVSGYVPPFDSNKLYDPILAKKELKESKYKGEELELLVHELAGSEQVGQLFQQQMKDLGIRIKLTKLDFNSVINRIVKGDAPLFSMFLEYVFSAPEPILSNFFTSAKRPVPNFWQYSNPRIDKEIESLRTIADRSAAIKKTEDIEEAIMEEAPAIFLYRQKYAVMYSRKFEDLTVNGHGHYQLEKLRLLK
jgi:peptide/nickel transport system substrate-binding protein